MMQETAPLIYHLATARQVAEAHQRGSVAPPSLAGEGFIHCSTAAQLASTVHRHYPETTGLFVIHLDPITLGDALVWEESRPGEVYPHVYREISMDEVVDVVAWSPPPG